MKFLLSLLTLLFSSQVLANSLTLELENDVLYNTDKNYTHGTRLTYEYNNLYWSIGQNIYTPSDISLDTVATNERPYSGSLYISLSGTKPWKDGKTSSGNSGIFHQLELAVGIVGKHSFSEGSQKTIHEWINAKEPMGWDYQTDDILLLQTSMKVYGDILRTPYVSSKLYVSGELGTIMSHAGGGGSMMVGYNIPKILNKPIASKRSEFSFYLYADGLWKHVFHNQLLESDYTDITHKKGVIDVRTGVGVIYKGVELRYSRVMRSKEFEEQEDPAIFGSFLVKFEL